MPLMINWPYALAGVGLALAIGFGGGYQVRDWQAKAEALKASQKVIERQNQVIEKDRAAAQITEDVGRKASESQNATRIVYRKIKEEVPVYVTKESDAGCSVPVGFVGLHNAAASGNVSSLSNSAGQPFDAPSGVALSTVASVVADNYGTCHEEIGRLRAWQEWYAAQKPAQ